MRVRRYVEDPSIGIEKIERILDAAHALHFNAGATSRSQARREGAGRARDRGAQPRFDPFHELHAREDFQEPNPQGSAIEPDEDVLLFIRDHNPYLAEWEKDLLTIVDEEAKYFIPKMETKIMNEGWASYWHQRDSGSPGASTGPPSRVHRPAQPGGEAASQGGSIRTISDSRFGKTSVGDTKIRAREEITRRPAGQRATRSNLRGARDRTRLLVPAPLSHRRADARDGHVPVRASAATNLVIAKVSDDDGWKTVKETIIKNVGRDRFR